MVKSKRSVKGKLLKGVIEHIPSKSFEIIAESIEETMKGKSGIYALYKKNKLYYVGLATSLRGRIKKHTKDKHTNKWDTFSVYIIERTQFLKDIETIIILIADPSGNSVKGKIPQHHALRKILEKDAKQKAKDSANLMKALKDTSKKRSISKTSKKRTVRKKMSKKISTKIRRKKNSIHHRK